MLDTDGYISQVQEEFCEDEFCVFDIFVPTDPCNRIFTLR